jgi:hypothetical protein
LPSIYLLNRIAPFSSIDEQGHYHLTASSVHDAIEQGRSIEDILFLLRALHVGPIPHTVERQILAWGHYYGDAAIQQVTLVQIKDPKTLNELLDEPQLRALLKPFIPAPDRALALVASDKLDALLELLAQFGLSVHNQLDQAALQPNPIDSHTALGDKS